MKRDDEKLLRLAFAVATKARDGGDHPFGSILADAEGNVLMQQGNGYSSEGNDRTAHAERLLASRAARAYEATFLSTCTLYTSAEPCAMCAGAIYWAGIGRVVYGQTEKDLKAVFPREKWSKLHLQMIYYGREHCPARNHDPVACEICNRVGKSTSRK